MLNQIYSEVGSSELSAEEKKRKYNSAQYDILVSKNYRTIYFFYSLRSKLYPKVANQMV
jgi:hypothetical protein